MGTVASSIKLVDNMTPVVSSMLKSMNMMVSTFENVDKASQNCIDIKSLAAARAEMNNAATAAKAFEKSIKDAEKSQKNMNNTTVATGSSFNGLVGKIGGVIAAYATLQGVQKALDLSDQYTSTTARLDLMNDGLQSTEDLQNRIFKSAQDSRGLYTATADAVSKMGLMAKDAFSSNTETIDFMEQINKQFVMSGTSAQGAEAATLQLTQAMAGGVLRGEELNSIFENAPTIIQSIAKYMNVPIGQIRKMAEAGELTAETVKKAMFATAEETNKKFNSMPKTFNQVWNSFSNVASKSFQGVFDNLSDLANSPELEGFLNAVAGGITTAANVISTLQTGVSNILEQAGTINLGVDINVVVTEVSEDITSSISKIEERLKTHEVEIKTSLNETANSWDVFVQRISQGNSTLNSLNWESGIADWFADWIGRTAKGAEVLGYIATEIVDLHNLFSAIWAGDFEGANGWLLKIQDDAYQMQKVMADAGGKSTTSYAQGVESTLPIMQQAVQRSTDTAMVPMTTLPAATGLLGQQAGNNFAGGLLINQAAVGTAAQGMHDTTITALNPLPDNLTNIGAGASAGLGAGITANTETAGTASDLLNARIQNGLNPIVPFGTQTGINVGDGLANGLNNRQGAIGTESDNIIQLVIKKFMNGFDMHSPSKLSENWGYNLIEGWINGLDGDRLVSFVDAMIARIKAAAEGGSFNIKAGIDFLGNGAEEFFKSIGIGGASLGNLVTPVAGAVTSGFGSRDAFMTDSGQMSSSYHEGIDIGAGFNTPVGAAGAGEVVMAGWNGGYGNTVKIDHGNGLVSMYAHLDSIAVSIGDIVSKLQTIGLVGSTGNSTGAHLHFGLYQDGAAIDPSALFGGYATGTNFATRGLHLVGERGPEIVDFGGGETVLNAEKSKSLLKSVRSSNSGNKTFAPVISVSLGDTVVNSELDVDVIAKKLGKKIKDEIILEASGLYEAS